MRHDLCAPSITLPAFILLIALLCTACTRPPVAELTAYQAAFAQSRTAGEEVLLTCAALRARTQPTSASPADPRPSALAPEPTEITTADELSTYLLAWDALAHYNDFLAGILEGRDPTEIKASYSAFQHTLSALPTSFASQLASSITPATPLIELAVTAAARESRHRRFLDKVAEGGPIALAILQVHFDNADDIYSVLYLENEKSTLPAVNSALASLSLVSDLFTSAALPDEPEAWLRFDALRSSLAAAYPSAPFELPPLPDSLASGSAPADAAQLASWSAQLRDAQLSLSSSLDSVHTLNARLRADHQLLSSYRALLTLTQDNLRSLITAAAVAPLAPPDPDLIREAVTRVRFALVSQKESR